MVVTVPIRSDRAPAATRPITDPMPYAVSASDAPPRLTPWSRAKGTMWTVTMKVSPPSSSHARFRHH